MWSWEYDTPWCTTGYNCNNCDINNICQHPENEYFTNYNLDMASGILAELGIDVKDPNNGNYRLFSDVINDLAEKWDIIEEEDKESIRKTFNKEG